MFDCEEVGAAVTDEFDKKHGVLCWSLAKSVIFFSVF